MNFSGVIDQLRHKQRENRDWERTRISSTEFYLQAKRDFDSGEKEFQVNFVVTYFFR